MPFSFETALLDPELGFAHWNAYRGVRIGTREFVLSEPQAMVVRLLDQARLTRTPDVDWETISTQLPTMPHSMSDVFKDVDGWRDLVTWRRRGLYRLNL